MTQIKAGTTNVVRYFKMRLVADGSDATGLVATTFDLQYTRELTAAATKIDGIVGTGGATTHVDNKVFEVDATSSPGLYMVCFPDAAFAAGVAQVTLNLMYDATVFTEAQNIDLIALDLQDAVRMGMTALPNAAADAAGGLVISDAGAQDFDAMNAAAIRLTAVRAATLTDLIDAGRLDTIFDTINTAVAGLAGAAMRGTDSANTVTPLDAAGIRTAVGLAAANLDTQFSAAQVDLDLIINYLDTEIAAILAAVTSTGVVLNAAQMNSIADHVIRRTAANVRASADGDVVNPRSLLGAVSKLTNKVGVVATNLIAYEEDDVTAFLTQAITTDATADPIKTLDTA